MPTQFSTATAPDDPTLVLLVEDSRADAYLVRLLARDWQPPVDVEVVTSGEAALRRLGCSDEGPVDVLSPNPDLVLLDLNLPRLSGHDVLATLRKDLPNREFPVVVFSTSSDSRDESQARSLGADDYVTKPGSLTDFEDAICGLLHRYTPTKPGLDVSSPPSQEETASRHCCPSEVKARARPRL